MDKIELDLRRDLAKVTPKTIGGFGECRYSAPCAIGAMMTPEQRAALANDNRNESSILALIEDGVVSVPDDQTDDFIELQDEFDSGNFGGAFDATLARLKQKYHVPS